MSYNPNANFDEPFDFTRKAYEDKNWQPDYSYLGGGGLGAEEYASQKAAKQAKGKLDLAPVAPPDSEEFPEVDANYHDERRKVIEKTATLMAKMKDINFAEENIFLKDGNKYRFLKDFKEGESK